MADTVTLPGTGAVVATDEVTDGTLGTVQVQYVKVMDGTLNGTNKQTVGSDGGALVTYARPSTATITSVAGSATTVSLLASNTGAKLRTAFNDSTATLYLKYGTTASTSSYTVQMPPNSYYEFPQPLYTGAVDGIWSAANGNVRLTEVT
ncbi:MAG: hypothetical protein J2P17_29365 [Mycobacterium sp.]|nr:hypothetical protein [Mycobacterium sp.]